MQRVSIDRLKQNDDLMRLICSDDEFELLKGSLEEVGQKAPILVKKDKENGFFIVIDGHRRLQALKELNKEHPGKFSDAAIIILENVEDELLDSFVLNTTRENFSEYDRILIVNRLARREKNPLTTRDIAPLLGYKNPRSVYSIIELGNLPEHMLKSIETNKNMSVGHLKCLVRVKRQYREELFEMMVTAEKMTVREAEEAVSDFNDCGKVFTVDSENQEEQINPVVYFIEKHFGVTPNISATTTHLRVSFEIEHRDEEIFEGLQEEKQVTALVSNG